VNVVADLLDTGLSGQEWQRNRFSGDEKVDATAERSDWQFVLHYAIAALCGDCRIQRNAFLRWADFHSTALSGFG
jgi:hypothetical protein